MACPDARVVVGHQRQVADRIGVVGVEAERDDQGRIGVERPDGLESLLGARPGRRRRRSPAASGRLSVAPSPSPAPRSVAYPE